MGKAGGAIVNFSSIAGFLGNVGQANYSASKGGRDRHDQDPGPGRSAQPCAGERGFPRFIATPMTETIPPEIKEAAISKIPLQRIGMPEDVANAVLFLVSTCPPS
jgi:3-oxoacyl-[acyl-carrier protein] reductase